MARAKKTTTNNSKEAKTYNHSEETPQRPDIGTEAQFKKKKPPATYRYDSSIAPSLEWDNNPCREQAEALIKQILEAEDIESAKLAANQLKKLTQPFLNWTGKAERLSFEVPTLPLFVHERLSTRAIIQTLKSHIPPTPLTKGGQPPQSPLNKGGQEGGFQLSLFSDPQWSITDQILKAYEYKDKWVNRMIAGDSLVTMNSLLQYEGMGGQVQMIYIDPPYGVKFGSNFQPFVRKRDVKHNDDQDLTREPETVKAYRDTWELGLHSYLTYLRDRLLLARDLLTDSGSVFVQISDENLHHVRELMDEVFGSENFCSIITFQKTSYATSILIPPVTDYLVWYSKNKQSTKFNKLYFSSLPKQDELRNYYIDIPNEQDRKLNKNEIDNPSLIPNNAQLFQSKDLTSSGAGTGTFDFEFQGKIYNPGANRHWKTHLEGLNELMKKNRLFASKNSLRYKRYITDYPWTEYINVWTDTITGSFTEEKSYVVQTSTKVIERCLLMTTDPGDLVLDITCGSGTTAYVAEQWGRRWITCDVSRVPLALARQRLLTATFPWYELKDGNSPSGGFVYKRKQNKKGEEIGGIVPHITLKSIANNEPPAEEILVDRPESDNSVVRVCSPFTIEGTIPPPVDMNEEEPPLTPPCEGRESEAPLSKGGWGDQEGSASFTDRMLEVLRQSPILHLPDNKTVELTNVRQPAQSQNIHAEAMVVDPPLTPPSKGGETEAPPFKKWGNGSPLSKSGETEAPLTKGGLGGSKPVAFLFGSENGAIAERTVFETAKEAHSKGYSHLYVIGFAISANARQFVENCQITTNIPATYIQATPDLLMGDLLKNMRSSQIFSVCGLPDIKLIKLEGGKYQVELLGLDVFDPVTMEVDHEHGNNVPAWFLDTDYNGLCFYVRQAFFPRTSAWESIKKALKGSYEESVWEHLAGTISAPFTTGVNKEIAVKVIDDRGNELLVVKELK